MSFKIFSVKNFFKKLEDFLRYFEVSIISFFHKIILSKTILLYSYVMLSFNDEM